jgi:hypothetical protein
MFGYEPVGNAGLQGLQGAASAQICKLETPLKLQYLNQPFNVGYGTRPQLEMPFRIRSFG